MGTQFERVVWPGIIIVCLGFIVTCVNLFVYNSGHPINLITGGLDILFALTTWILVKIRKAHYSSWLAVPFFLYHTLAVVFVYKEWLPNYFNRYPKVNTDYMILLSFITLNSVPLTNYKQTLFFMLPILLATSSVQFQITSKLLE